MTTLTLPAPITLDQLDHTSASAVTDWLACPRMWHSIRIDKTPSVSGAAADLGTVGHRAAELFVADGHHLEEDPVLVDTQMIQCLIRAVSEVVSSTSSWSEFETVHTMLTEWSQRQDWTKFIPEATELNYSFEVKTPSGLVVPVQARMDRVDRRVADDMMQVVDYKFGWYVENANTVADSIQANVYGLALSKMHPGQPLYPVMFENMRKGAKVGVRFSPDQLAEFEQTLGGWIDDMYTAEEIPEVLCSECRWCPRRDGCDTAQAAIAANNVKTMTPDELAAHAVELELRIKAAEASLFDVKGELVTIFKRDDAVQSIQTERGKVAPSVAGRRALNPDVVPKFVDHDALVAIGAAKYSLRDWDDMIEGATDDEADAMRAAISTSYSSSVRVSLPRPTKKSSSKTTKKVKK